MFHRLKIRFENWFRARAFPLPDVVRFVADAAAPADFSLLLDASRLRPPTDNRRLATLLAATLPPGLVMAVLRRFTVSPPHLEFLACLTQEALIRGTNLARLAEIAIIWRSLREVNSPLQRLPLQLTPLEGRLRNYVPEFSGSGSGSRPTPACILSELPIGPLRSLQERLTLSEVTDPAGAARIGAAVRNWKGESNGEFEARVFNVSQAIREHGLATESLLSLRLKCLQGANPESVQMAQLSPEQAINSLFAAAANGGAYNWGLGAAYGRLAAWQSAGSMAGAAETDSVEDLAALARRCQWLWFTATSDWFYSIQDMGLIAIRPDRMSLAVLAATDTD
jgi:hypothetical protein